MGAGVLINQPLGSYWHLLGGAGMFLVFKQIMSLMIHMSNEQKPWLVGII